MATLATPSPPPPGAGRQSLLESTVIAAGPCPDQDAAEPGARRRSARDWFVDASAFLLAIWIGTLFVWSDRNSSSNEASDLMVEFDVGFGLLCCLALWWRRRWPVLVGLAVVPVAEFSSMSSMAVLIAMFSVAVHRRPTIALLVGAANLASVPIYLLVRGPANGSTFWVTLVVASVFTGAVLGWGMLVRSRREY